MNRIIYASCFVIDYDNKKVLLMFSEKLNKWIQPGTGILENESTINTAIRGVKELTGVDCEIVQTLFGQDYLSPVDVVEYTKDDDVVYNIEFLATPVTHDITNAMSNAEWLNIDELINNENVDEEITYKVNTLYKLFKNDGKKRTRRN